jgi:hypothetical protein
MYIAPAKARGSSDTTYVHHIITPAQSVKKNPQLGLETSGKTLLLGGAEAPVLKARAMSGGS